MTQQSSGFSSMFGAFDLLGTSDLATFQNAFDAFCENLKEAGYVHSWFLWERAYHDGYDTGFPDVNVLLEMRFHDHQASLEAWDYIEATSEPINTLHLTMIGQITDSVFALYNRRG